MSSPLFSGLSVQRDEIVHAEGDEGGAGGTPTQEFTILLHNLHSASTRATRAALVPPPHAEFRHGGLFNPECSVK